ncbi:MAG TPA: T9SS type A sorting domain-containing protein [Ignavibacteria bacterium]|nr:T9SS type A sorting domain-containing protein [Ignavibacteria bacterium]
MKNFLIIYSSLLFINLSSMVFSQSSWRHAGNLSQNNTDNIYSMTENSTGDIFASSWAVGIFKSTDNGSTWTTSGLDGKRVSVLRTAPNGYIFALSKTVSEAYIHRSTDNGNTWTDVDTRSFPLNYAGGGEIVFPPDGSVIAAYAVTVGPTIGDVATFVIKSSDNGNSWTQIHRFNIGFVGGMIIAHDNKILLGTSLSGVIYSVNNGINFSSLTTFPPFFIKTILRAPEDLIYVSDAFGLNRSTDNGLTFTDAGINFNSYLNSAGVNSNGDLFVEMDDGNVYYSDDKGENWNEINNGLPETGFVRTFFSHSGKMYAGTSNNGIYIYDALTSVKPVTENADGFTLHQNYPNPFNPVTKIKFDISNSVNVELSLVNLNVYDALGKKIMSLVNERLNAGSYEVDFNGEDLASGIYFYKLESGNISIVKKMSLLR